MEAGTENKSEFTSLRDESSVIQAININNLPKKGSSKTPAVNGFSYMHVSVFQRSNLDQEDDKLSAQEKKGWGWQCG